MCGFVGFCNSNIASVAQKRKITEVMVEKIKHRGPDDSGYFDDESTFLGFARLKILDLEGGYQPMKSADGRYVLCFNGEIYNYKELRAELEREFGQQFIGKGDTEVLLYTLIQYKEQALEKIRGMFALAFYDTKEKALLLARDPFGIKPLYYGTFDDCFMFASEIKAFLPHPQFKKSFNSEVLPYYLQFQYVPTEETAFVGVKRLMAGQILRYVGGKFEVEKYFEMPEFSKKAYTGYSFFAKEGKKEPFCKNIGQLSEQLCSVLEKSVEKHLQSDVAVGGFLSGGVDSGLICTLAEPKKLFTVGFKNAGFDERAYAFNTAQRLGIPIASFEIDAEDFFDSVGAVQYHSDEPYANLSAIPLYLLSKCVKEDVSVILSGEGADELFGGYEWYQDSAVGKLYRKLPQGLRHIASKRALEGRIGDFLKRNVGDARRDFIGQARIMTPKEACSILSKPYKRLISHENITAPIYKEVKNASLLRKKMYLDSLLWLPFDILNKADKMTMASSLELRVPYLDLSVLEIAQKCADATLIRAKNGKYVLRRAALKYLDSQTAYRSKKGFPVPFREWIREKRYACLLEKAFSEKTAKRFFDTDKLILLLKEHVKGQKNNARTIYTVYAFILWYEIFFEGEANERIYTDNTRS